MRSRLPMPKWLRSIFAVKSIDGVNLPRWLFKFGRFLGPFAMLLLWPWMWFTCLVILAWYRFCGILEFLGLSWLWTKNQFLFSTKTVRRPKEFSGRAYREEFDLIGTALSNPPPPTSDATNCFSELLVDGVNDLPRNRCEARRKIMGFFAKEGILIERWVLLLPEVYDDGSQFLRADWKTRKISPEWDAEGNKLPRAWKFPEHGPIVYDASSSDPSFLTHEQMLALIGVEYRLRPLYDELELEPRDDEERRLVEEKIAKCRAMPKYKVTANDFERIYYRPPEVIFDDIRKEHERELKERFG